MPTNEDDPTEVIVSFKENIDGTLDIVTNKRRLTGCYPILPPDLVTSNGTFEVSWSYDWDAIKG